MNTENKRYQDSGNTIRNMKVALFCLAGILIFYFGANLLKGVNAFGKKTRFYAVFGHSGGLQESTAVLVNGYRIGKVNRITLLNSCPVRICAEILVTEDIGLPEDSKFEIAQKDVLGGTVVNVIMGRCGHHARNGDTLQGCLAPPLLGSLDTLEYKLRGILTSVDTISLSVKQLFNPDDPGNGALLLKQTLCHLETASGTLNRLLNDNSGKASRILDKFDQIGTTLQKAAPQIEAVADNLEHITDTLARSNIMQLLADAQSAAGRLDTLAGMLRRGEGTAGQLLNNDTLYRNIDNTAKSLDILLKDIKENPKRYLNVTVFGKREKTKKTITNP